ncbi:MAG: 4-hydroxy-tetrahydrodipicolinate synthase [bacterium]|nr:4-hydroxy-tetrahydrodipicolinate synthase [bacterium]
MNRLLLTGCGTALLTPFKNNEVDYQAFAASVERQVESGINFLVPLGSTAETPCLDDEERINLLECCREHAHGLPLVVGAGTNSFVHTVKNMKLLDSHGVDAFLIVVPYYNKPTQEGLYQYFKEIAQSTSKDIVLYNVPGRTGVNLATETTLRLAEINNIIAIKEASSNYQQISEIICNAPAGFTVLSGNDNETLSLIASGAHGVISVASNIVPSLMMELVNAIRNGNLIKARNLHFKLMPLFKNCFVESNPIPAKAAMHALGLMDNSLRSPLTPASESTYQLMVDTLRQLDML